MADHDRAGMRLCRGQTVRCRSAAGEVMVGTVVFTNNADPQAVTVELSELTVIHTGAGFLVLSYLPLEVNYRLQTVKDIWDFPWKVDIVEGK